MKQTSVANLIYVWLLLSGQSSAMRLTKDDTTGEWQLMFKDGNLRVVSQTGQTLTGEVWFDSITFFNNGTNFTARDLLMAMNLLGVDLMEALPPYGLGSRQIVYRLKAETLEIEGVSVTKNSSFTLRQMTLR